MNYFWQIVLGVVILVFVIRLGVFNIEQAKARRELRYFDQLRAEDVAVTIDRAWSLHERKAPMDIVSLTAIRAELMGTKARLIAIEAPSDLKSMHGLYVDSVSLALEMWDTNDMAKRAKLYAESYSKWSELAELFKTRPKSRATGFRTSVIGAFLLGTPKG